MPKIKPKQIEQKLAHLYEEWAGESIENCTKIAQSGGDRVYYRLKGKTKSAIGAYSPDEKENKAFLTFTKHFYNRGLNVPEVYLVAKEGNMYLQSDLGDTALYQLLPTEGKPFSENLVDLYKKIIRKLTLIQIKGGEDLDYSVCYPRAA